MVEEPAILEETEEAVIVLSRADAKKRHDLLLAEIQHLRELLKYPPLPTGKQQRKQAA